MKMKLVGTSFVFCLLGLNFIMPKNIAISQSDLEIIPGKKALYAKTTPIGVVADLKWGKFQSMLSVPEAVSSRLSEKYPRISRGDELPIYKVPITEIEGLAAEANEAVDETIRWLIGKVNELEERVKTLEEKR